MTDMISKAPEFLQLQQALAEFARAEQVVVAYNMAFDSPKKPQITPDEARSVMTDVVLAGEALYKALEACDDANLKIRAEALENIIGEPKDGGQGDG